jgi:hypothetical protein
MSLVYFELQQRFLIERLKEWRQEEILELDKLLTKLALKIASARAGLTE